MALLRWQRDTFVSDVALPLGSCISRAAGKGDTGWLGENLAGDVISWGQATPVAEGEGEDGEGGEGEGRGSGRERERRKEKERRRGRAKGVGGREREGRRGEEVVW